MRAQKLTIAALALAAGLALTACQNDDAAMGQDTSATGSSSSSSTGGSGSGSGSGDKAAQGSAKGSGGTKADGQGGSEGTGSDTNNGTEKCRTGNLDITAQDTTITGEDPRTVAVTFMNVGGHDCSLSGFAGVDLKTNAGTISAQREGDPADATVLKNGKSVSFYISYPANDTGGSGVRITGLVVTPPNETKSVTLTWPGAGSLPASDDAAPVKVGPIGSAGQGG
ncbi:MULTISPECIES: DUF4232 domain-containing protein [unclassified Streptomyces]|uniref:DUF4232 domain-containing protein n=1 Tax=unclassified Streptomyces TaxID=2593676 RepID=UPI0004C0FDDC|nr:MULTISPECIES: DUF4232 domain-containing protein [unclassified Streptomyces]